MTIYLLILCYDTSYTDLNEVEWHTGKGSFVVGAYQELKKAEQRKTQLNQVIRRKNLNIQKLLQDFFPKAPNVWETLWEWDFKNPKFQIQAEELL